MHLTTNEYKFELVGVDNVENVEKLAKLLIGCRDITGWDEIPTYRYITSDGVIFDDDKCWNAEKEALEHEIEWLNANV